MADLVGHQLGNYRLSRLLGKGGFADVYLGEHVHLNTLAAMKVLQTRLEGNSVEQFRNEARLIAHLKHPNIIPILDFNVQRDIPFLVMEYAVNGTLRQHLTHRLPLPPTTALLYVRQVASALQYAHDQHLIHRDVKPENMLLGTNNEVLLSDFGLALITESMHALARSSASALDASGTVYYMAPEQIQGHPIAASDQYALGVVLYEWLTGMRPFNGSTYVEIAMQHVSAPPVSMRSRVPTIPREIEEVVYRALAKDPQQRFPNIILFANAFEQACKITPPLPGMSSRTDSTVRVANSQPTEVILQGPAGAISLGASVVTIGRDASNQFILNDPQVSARHAIIRPEGQGYNLMDVGSVNGTSINGQKISQNTPYPLRQGDAIGVGSSKLVFEVRSSGNMPPMSFSRQPTERAEMPVWPNSSYGMPLPMTPPPPPPQQPVHLPQPNPPSFDSAVNPYSSTGSIPPISVPNSFNASQPGQINQPPPTPAAPGPSRKRLWIALSVLAALLVILAAGGGVFAYVNSLSTPAKTLDAFCVAIQTGNDTAAYNQLSSTYQKEVSRPDFESFYGKANTCTHTAPAVNGSTAQADWTLSFSGQNSTVHGDLNQDSGGTWKISDDTQLFGLVKTLDAYCTALQSGDHATAYAQFSTNLQHNMASDLFGNLFPQMNSCNRSGIALTTKGAIATLTTVAASGQNTTNTVTMIQDANKNWKFDDFNSLPAKTMSTFCTALQQNVYQTAYNQFSTAEQGRTSESQFADTFKYVTGCTPGAITFANNHMSTITTIVLSNGTASATIPFTSYLVQDNTGTWKIDTFTNPPYDAMNTFCNAIDQKDYQTAYNQFSTGFQSATSEQSFASAFTDITGCTFVFPKQNGSSAVSLVTFTHSNGQQEVLMATLVQTSDGEWKIEGFTRTA